MAEEGVKVSTHSEVGDGEVAHDTETETDTSHSRPHALFRVVVEDVTLGVKTELEVAGD